MHRRRVGDAMAPSTMKFWELYWAERTAPAKPGAERVTPKSPLPTPRENQQ